MNATISLRRRAADRTATVVITGCFLAALVPLLWLLVTVVQHGWHAIVTSSWWQTSQRGVGFRDPGGGALHAIVGTAEQVALCSVISVPIGLLVGIQLVEYGRGRFARITSFAVDVLTGIPSIVAALFVYAVAITTFGGQRAGWLVSLALVVLMLPVVVRATEEMLRLVPDELREASYALGVPKWKTIWRVVLPSAFSGLVTGVLLGVARVAGETAPLLILVGYASGMNTDLFSGFQASLPGMINDQFTNLGTGGQAYGLDANGNRVPIHNYAPDRLWGAALTLILVVLALNFLARLIGRRAKG